jgi:hypothetical protein
MEFSMKNYGVIEERPGRIFELISGKGRNQVHIFGHISGCVGMLIEKLRLSHHFWVIRTRYFHSAFADSCKKLIIKDYFC